MKNKTNITKAYIRYITSMLIIDTFLSLDKNNESDNTDYALMLILIIIN